MVLEDDGRKRMFDYPVNVRLVIRWFIYACIFLAVLDIAIFLLSYFHVIHVHHVFKIEGYPCFYPAYGFVACVLLVLVAKQLRRILMRDEATMIPELHPGALLLLGGLMVPLLRGRALQVFLFLLPAAALMNMIGVKPGADMTVSLMGYNLHVVRIDKLSLLFGYLFHIAALLASIYSLRKRKSNFLAIPSNNCCCFLAGRAHAFG